MTNDGRFVINFQKSVRELCYIIFDYNKEVCVEFYTKYNPTLDIRETYITYYTNGKQYYGTGLYWHDKNYKRIYHSLAEKYLKSFKFWLKRLDSLKLL